MAEIPPLMVAAMLALTLLVALGLLRTRQDQVRRLELVGSRLSHSRPKASHRAVPLHSLVPPGEERQPEIRGVRLPGGRMAWTGPLEAGEALAGIVLARQAPTAYLGPAPDLAVLQLGRAALQAGVDPRPRLIVTAGVRELEALLESRTLPPPWVVVEGSPDLEGLSRLHARFGSPILLVDPPSRPEGYRALP